MNFFSVCFRTSRAIPGKIPGQACGGDPSPLRKGLQSFPESTPVLPGKNWSTLRIGLETDQEGKRLSIEDILHPSEKISSFAREDILLPPLKIYLTRPLSRPFRARENKNGHDIVGR